MSTQEFRLEPEFPDEDQQQPATVTELVPIAMQEASLPEEAIILAGHMGRISAKLEQAMIRLEELGNGTAQMIDSVRPTDQATYEELYARMQDGKKFIETAEEFLEPWRTMFYRPYLAVLNRTKQIMGGVVLSLDVAKNRRIAFEREVKAAQDRETARLQAEAKQREEEQRLQSAVRAEEIGMSPAAVETILTQPSIAPLPVAAPAVTRPQGMRKLPENWAAELVSPQEFWKWAKTQKTLPPCIEAGMAGVQIAMNREAKTHRAKLGIVFPGWRGVDKNH